MDEKLLREAIRSAIKNANEKKEVSPFKKKLDYTDEPAKVLEEQREVLMEKLTKLWVKKK
jgi:hypothetical protein